MIKEYRNEVKNSTWQTTMDVFDDYERRFAKARLEKEPAKPWIPEDREMILSSVKRMLRYREGMIPQIRRMEEMSRQAYTGYSAIQYRFESWKHMYGAATLYLPEITEKLPLVFVCCGHGKNGRLTSGYMAMGHRLASIGIAAMVVDNIGQGDRNRNRGQSKTPDHWMAVAPFACGLTMQGLIVMETVGLIRYMRKDPRFDPARFGACGNSGGGTLTMFLAALAPELSAIASCGYPSETAYLLQKERRHCACNLLIGAANEAEMWEIYSLFAPKPLLLEGGKYDDLIPSDLALRNARKVRNTYLQLDADNCFRFGLTNTKHSWELEDINLISGFMSEILLGVKPEDAADTVTANHLDPLRVEMPDDMLTTKQLSETLSGINVPEEWELKDVFPPIFRGRKIAESELETDVGRGDVMRVFAQYECSLYEEPTKD